MSHYLGCSMTLALPRSSTGGGGSGGLPAVA